MILLRKIWSVRLLYLMFLPCLIYFVIFKYVPLYGILIVFKNYSPFQGIWGSPWAGLEHFRSMLTDPYFYKLFKNTVVLALYSILFGFPAPILFALFLNEVKHRFLKRLVQSVTFFPYFISSAVAVAILYSLLAPQQGIVNVVLYNVFQAGPFYFMLDPAYFRSLYNGLMIWQGFGYGAIIYLAAMTSIDQSLYEAAEIDGASRWRKMWHVTLPGISSTIIILLILRIGSILSVDLETILLMYNPNLYDVADVLASFVYRKAFPANGFPDYSYAAAVGLFQSVVALSLVLAANALAKRYSSSKLF